MKTALRASYYVDKVSEPNRVWRTLFVPRFRGFSTARKTGYCIHHCIPAGGSRSQRNGRIGQRRSLGLREFIVAPAGSGAVDSGRLGGSHLGCPRLSICRARSREPRPSVSAGESITTCRLRLLAQPWRERCCAAQRHFRHVQPKSAIKTIVDALPAHGRGAILERSGDSRAIMPFSVLRNSAWPCSS